MTHDECLGALLTAIRAGPGSESVAATVQEHLAGCWDCWQAAEALLGRSEADAEELGRMEALFGCADVREQLFLLTDASPDQLSRHPQLVRHVGWCRGCRARLAEAQGVQQLAERGDIAPLFAPSPPRWKERLGSLPEVVLELAERTVVRMREGFVSLAAVPAGVFPAPSPQMSMRTTTADGRPEVAGWDMEIDLPESGLMATLSFHALETRRVGLDLQLGGAGRRRYTVALRSPRAGNEELLVLRTAYGEGRVEVARVPRGEYLLEIREPDRKTRFRVPLTVECEGG